MAFFSEVTPPVNIGSKIGQAMGQGLQSGMGQAFQTQYQRGLLQNALGQVRQLSQQPGSKPMDLMLGMMEAGAGIPGSEKYMTAILPMILKQAQAQGIFGGEGELTPEQRTAKALEYKPGQEGATAAEPVPGQIGPGLTPPQAPRQRGFLAPIMNPDQMDSFAKNYATTMMDPAQYETGYNIAKMKNEQAINSREMLATQAIQSGKVKAEDASYFKQIMQRYAHLDNPDEIVTSGIRDYKKFQSAKDKLDNVVFPGIGRGIAGKIPPVAGLLKDQTRDKILKTIQPSVKDLVDLGFEDYVRNKLASENLSPTEVDETIFPFSDQQLNNIKSFPNAGKTPPKIRDQRLSNFMLNNITPKTSILALRQRLWDDKGYEWQEIGPSIRDAITKGLELTPQQSTELTVAETDPPRQSMASIFRDWGRWTNYLRGEK